jgi:hypothetical protein
MLNLLIIMPHILLQRCALFRLFMITFPTAPIDLISFNAASAPHVDATTHVEQMITIHEQKNRTLLLLMQKIKLLVVKEENLLLLSQVIWFGCT